MHKKYRQHFWISLQANIRTFGNVFEIINETFHEELPMAYDPFFASSFAIPFSLLSIWRPVRVHFCCTINETNHWNQCYYDKITISIGIEMYKNASNISIMYKWIVKWHCCAPNEIITLIKMAVLCRISLKLNWNEMPRDFPTIWKLKIDIYRIVLFKWTKAIFKVRHQFSKKNTHTYIHKTHYSIWNNGIQNIYQRLRLNWIR